MRSKEESVLDLNDWSSRFMRIRAELVIFSTILLFIGVLDYDISKINLFFISIENPSEVKNFQFYKNIFITCLWTYLFLALIFRWCL